jgi:hypothetical protein
VYVDIFRLVRFAQVSCVFLVDYMNQGAKWGKGIKNANIQGFVGFGG